MQQVVRHASEICLVQIRPVSLCQFTSDEQSDIGIYVRVVFGRYIELNVTLVHASHRLVGHFDRLEYGRLHWSELKDVKRRVQDCRLHGRKVNDDG